MDENKVMVSIVCNAFNHGEFIAAALDGFLKQKTNFKYEILIHDDASTDNTADIIKSYENKYPEIVKPIYQAENQYSKGVHIGFVYQYSRAKVEYIAFCEGDDYWTDENKLQKQFDFMEKHPEIDMCAHAANAVQGDKVIRKISPSDDVCILKPEQVIVGGGDYVATNSLFFRKSMLNQVPDFYNYLPLDYTLQIWGSLRGGLLYIPDMMSVYRFATPGSWTMRVSRNKEAFLKHRKKVIEALKIANDETDKRYSDTIEKHILKLEFNALKITGDITGMKSEKYTDLYSRLTFSDKINLYIKHFVPAIANIKK